MPLRVLSSLARSVCRSHPRALVTLAALLVLQAAGAVELAAQGEPLPMRDTSEGHKSAPPLFTRRDAYIAGGFALTTVALFPLDKQIAQGLQNPNTQANRFFRDAATGFELIASPGAYIIGGTMYVVGRITHFDRVADLGWHGSEAVIAGDAVTVLLKGILGRARPSVSVSNPGNWNPFRGFGDGELSSFPSGHTTTAFAAAAAVTSETTRWWPRSTWFFGPVLYGGATMVGLSRMYHNRHWASDVALGAAIGTFSGLKVVQFSHTHAGNRLDRTMLHTSLIPTADGGLAVRVTLPSP